MNRMMKNLFVLAVVTVVMSLGFAEIGESVQIVPGTYVLKGEFMSGTLNLSKAKKGYTAHVFLKSSAKTPHVAELEAPATIQGNKITVKELEYGAKLIITFINDKKLTIDANLEAQNFAGAAACFGGDYSYKAKKSGSASK